MMDRENFQQWFTNVLAPLFQKRDAGLVILMTAFPLLERYIRQKTPMSASDNFGDDAKALLLSLFPELKNLDAAGQFWQVFRHGLLHQVSFLPEKRSSGPKRPPVSLPGSRITHDIPVAIRIEADHSFTLQPVIFCDRVLSVIEADFATFIGGVQSTAYPFPRAEPYLSSAGTGTTYPSQVWVTGTNCDPTRK